jgi:hypothetical protein
MNIVFPIAFLIGSLSACQEFRKTEFGASLELAAETGFEQVFEMVSSALGFPVDIEIDFDPDHNLHPKCKRCHLHCIDDKGLYPEDSEQDVERLESFD